MAGSILAMPTNGDADWSGFVTIVERTYRGYMGVSISGIGTASAPTVLNGSVIEIGGSVYQFATAEAFTGTVASGETAYMVAVPSGVTCTVEYAASAPTWSAEKNGWYVESDRFFGQLLRDNDGTYVNKEFLSQKENRPPSWHKFADPTAGAYKASKTAGWTADDFTTGSLVVTFSEVPTGATAVRVITYIGGTASGVYYRPSGDTNISNTPHASGELTNKIGLATGVLQQVVMWLSADYKVQITVQNTATDVYLAYPSEYLL